MEEIDEKARSLLEILNKAAIMHHKVRIRGQLSSTGLLGPATKRAVRRRPPSTCVRQLYSCIVEE
jgi:hypothetical protein